MRLRPGVRFLTWHTTAPIELGGYAIPADADVICSPYAMQRDPRTLDHPLTLDPDRWTPERSESISRYALMPRGTGGRKCAGDHSAWQR